MSTSNGPEQPLAIQTPELWSPLSVGAEVSLNELYDLTDKGLVNYSHHPTLGLTIYGYTSRIPITDEQWAASGLLRQSRGLILDDDGVVRSRPFTKMDELAATDQLPSGPFTAYEKVDGSLGVQYATAEGPKLATRGSFIGAQAVRGSEMLEEFYSYPFKNDVTYMWEIIHLDHPHVVNYRGAAKLVLLGMIETATGEELALPEQSEVPFEVVKAIPGITNADELRALDEPNKEGFVVRMDDDGRRIKVKFPAYEYLATVRNGTALFNAWQFIQNGGSTAEYIASTPPNAQAGADQVLAELNRRVNQTIADAKALVQAGKTRRAGSLGPLISLIKQGRQVPRKVAWQALDIPKNPAYIAPKDAAGNYEGQSQRAPVLDWAPPAERSREREDE